ncbi:hypothetical protein ACN20G_16600 [Streptomyces sp. BI20]|uniref:hypothetical protein n=1 Tax=Streptomyces sp. BI20 TaxID=3403460 RepID=UPI003C70DF76
MHLPDSSTPPAPANLVVRYVNQVGAAVDLLDDTIDYTWQCHGCGDGGLGDTLHTYLHDANKHATVCRAVFNRRR